jgi:hypothetical protein
MTMLINEIESNQIKRNPALKNIKIDDAIIDIVDFFYPIPGFIQVLPLCIRTQDIMDIMNYSGDEANKLFKEMQQYYQEGEADRLLIPHFCNYMGVDELWVQLFLASLKEPRKPLSQQQPIVTQPNNGSVIHEQPSKLAQVIEQLKNGITVSRATLRERAKRWKLIHYRGEPMYKVDGNFRMVIYADEVAAILRIHLRTAQKMLQGIRKELKMTQRLPVSINKFCFFYPAYTEEDIRKALAIMYGEED